LAEPLLANLWIVRKRLTGRLARVLRLTYGKWCETPKTPARGIFNRQSGHSVPQNLVGATFCRASL